MCWWRCPAAPERQVKYSSPYDTKKPVIAFLKAREEISGLPVEVRSEPDLNQVKGFISEQIASVQ